MITVKSISSSPVTRFAEEELRAALERMGLAESGQIAFTLGRARAFPRFQPFFARARHDAVLLYSEDDLLFLVGNSDRAVLFAVYEYLERFLQVRWPMPGEEALPSQPGLVLPETPHFHEAHLKYRGHLIDTAIRAMPGRGFAGCLSFAEQPTWPIYESNILAHLAAAWNADADIDALLREHADAIGPHRDDYLECLGTIERLFDCSGRPDCYFPLGAPGKIKAQLAAIGNRFAEMSAGASSNEYGTVRLQAWLANMEYCNLYLDWVEQLHDAGRAWDAGNCQDAITLLKRSLPMIDDILQYAERHGADGAFLTDWVNLAFSLRRQHVEACVATLAKHPHPPAPKQIWDKCYCGT